MMELGKAKLRRNGLNNLLNALHPEHGLLWTDGRAIFLAPVHLYRDQVEKATSLRLGEFENVQSVHWSRCGGDGTCYMAAVHQHNVTVWQVSGAVPRLAFKQVRKINVQPVPQGCLWNPYSDVLCLLSRQQCSFYFRHSHNRGSFAFPSLEHEKISCGCWCPDGKRLVICVGSALLIYTWTDLDANIGDFVTTAWRLPGVSGSITAVVPASNSSLVCACDLPLDVLCKNNNSDAFQMPDVGHRQSGSDGILRPQENMSAKDSLLNLQPKTSHLQDTAMLSLVQLKPGLQDPTVMATTVVPGLLSPDILHFQVESQCIVVGSNSQSGLQIFALLDSHLLSAGHVAFDKEERPKGICGLHASQMTGSYGVVVLVGQMEPADATFPSANNTSSFSLTLKFFPTRPEKARALPNGHAASTKATSATSLLKSDSVREPRGKSVSESRLQTRQTSYKGERPDIRLRSPDRDDHPDQVPIKVSLDRISSGDAHPKLVMEISDSPRSSIEEVDCSDSRVSELETERVEFSLSAPQFSNARLSEQYELSQNGLQSKETKTSGMVTKTNSAETKTSAMGTKTNSAETKNSAMESKTNLKETNNNATGTKTNGTEAKTGLAESSLGQSTEGVSKPKAETLTNGHSEGRGESPLPGGQRSGNALSVSTTPVEAPSPSLSRRGRPTDDGSSICSSFNSSDSNYDVLEKQIQSQRDQIEALHKRLADLSSMVEDTACVFPVRYQKMSEPEAVNIVCVVGGARVSRKFLLDNGRLQLDPVKQAFGLLTVELILDGEPLVLGSNIDGYIPMKFCAGSILQVTGIPIAYSPQIAHKARTKEPAKP